MRLDIKSIALLVLTGACILFFGMWFFNKSEYKEKIKELDKENKRIELVRDSLKSVNASLKLDCSLNLESFPLVDYLLKN